MAVDDRGDWWVCHLVARHSGHRLGKELNCSNSQIVLWCRVGSLPGQ